MLGGAILLASSSFALAADDVMAGYYGNTVISKGAMGESHIHYKPDHTFNGSASGMMGSMDLKGTWKIDDKGQLCRTYETAPPGLPNPLCTPVEPHKAGDTWTMQMGGQSRTITLVSGAH
jgi:hypothetical protein